MATYTHFAKQPDVLKHLILCEVLKNETPQVYVETNSACAIYPMTQTPGAAIWHLSFPGESR